MTLSISWHNNLGIKKHDIAYDGIDYTTFFNIINFPTFDNYTYFCLSVIVAGANKFWCNTNSKNEFIKDSLTRIISRVVYNDNYIYEKTGPEDVLTHII